MKSAPSLASLIIFNCNNKTNSYIIKIRKGAKPPSAKEKRRQQMAKNKKQKTEKRMSNKAQAVQYLKNKMAYLRKQYNTADEYTDKRALLIEIKTLSDALAIIK